MAFSDTSPSPTPNDALGAALSRRVVLRWEVVVYALILIAAVFTRFWALGDRAMSHDESLHVYYSYNLYLRGDFDHTPLMHGPILFHANALMYALFGDNDFSGRIYTALLGVAMVFTPLLFQRWIGKWGALLACVMILVSPLLMYYNRYIREDTPAIMASLLMAWAILMYLNGPAEQRRKPRWLYVLSAAMLWNLGTKETAFMYVASFGLFFTLYWIVRMLQVRYQMAGKPIFSGLIMAILLGAFAAVP
nr:TIGR03663 family protein [Anaerolineae bacterium]